MQGWCYPKFKCLDALHTPSQRVKKLHFFRILTNHWGTDSGVAKRKWPLDKILVWTLNSDMHVCSVVSISLRPYQLQPVRLCLWDSPGKNIRVDCHFLFQKIFLTYRLNLNLLCLLYWQADSLSLSPLGNS